MKKAIVVALDDEEVKSLNLTMSFKVEAYIEIRPRSQVYVNTVAGSPAEGRVLLHRTDGAPLKIEQIRFENQDVVLAAHAYDPEDAAQPGFQAKPGDIWLTATVGPEVAAGQYTGNAWLTTNHPKMGELEIPVTVRLRPAVEVRPDQVQLWIDGQAAQRGSLIRLVHNREDAFRIVGIDVEDGELVKAELLDEGDSRAHSIRVRSVEGISAEDVSTPRTTKIVVRTSIADFPEVVVPVTVAGRRPVTRPLRYQESKKRAIPIPLPTGTPQYGKGGLD